MSPQPSDSKIIRLKRPVIWLLIAVIALSITANIILTVFVSLPSKTNGSDHDASEDANATKRNAVRAGASKEPVENAYWGKLEIARTASLAVQYKGFRVLLYQTRLDPTLYYFVPAMVFRPQSAKSVRNNLMDRYQLEFALMMYDDAYIAHLGSEVRRITGNRAEMRVIPMEEVRIDAVGTLSTEYEVDNNWKPYTRHPSEMTFRIFCTTQDACISAEEYANTYPKDFAANWLVYISIQSQVTKSRRVTVSAEHITNSKLYTELDQRMKGKKEVYLSDDDAKQISQEISQNVMASEVSDAEFVSQESSPSLMGLIEAALQMSTASSAGFDEHKWSSVFWQDDNARPDKVTSMVNEAYERLDHETRNLLKTAQSKTTVDRVCVAKNIATAATADAATTAATTSKETTEDDDDDDDEDETTKKGETKPSTTKGTGRTTTKGTGRTTAKTVKTTKKTTKKPTTKKPTTKKPTTKKPAKTTKPPKKTPAKKPAKKREIPDWDAQVGSLPVFQVFAPKAVRQEDPEFDDFSSIENSTDESSTAASAGTSLIPTSDDLAPESNETLEREKSLKLVLGLLVLKDVNPEVYADLIFAASRNSTGLNCGSSSVNQAAGTTPAQSPGNESLGLAVAEHLFAMTEDIAAAFMLGEAVLSETSDSDNETDDLTNTTNVNGINMVTPVAGEPAFPNLALGHQNGPRFTNEADFENDDETLLNPESGRSRRAAKKGLSGKVSAFKDKVVSSVGSYFQKLPGGKKPNTTDIHKAITTVGSVLKKAPIGNISNPIGNGTWNVKDLGSVYTSVFGNGSKPRLNEAGAGGFCKSAVASLNNYMFGTEATVATPKPTNKATTPSKNIAAVASSTKKPPSGTSAADSTVKTTAATKTPDPKLPQLYSCSDKPPVTTSSSKEFEDWNKLMTEKREVVKWKGEKFEPKELNLKRVNLAKMSSSTTIQTQQVRISTASAVMKTNINVISDEDHNRDAFETRNDPEVFFVRSSLPTTGFTFVDAGHVCTELQSQLASMEQLKKAFFKGARWCFLGHVQDKVLAYPGPTCTMLFSDKEAPKRTAQQCQKDLRSIPVQVVEIDPAEDSDMLAVAVCNGVKPPQLSTFQYKNQTVLVGPFNSTQYSIYGDVVSSYAY